MANKGRARRQLCSRFVTPLNPGGGSVLVRPRTPHRDQDFLSAFGCASSRLLASFRHLYLAPMRASASDAPCAHERRAWLEPDQSLPGSKCVRLAGHRLDCKTATADVGKRVAAKE